MQDGKPIEYASRALTPTERDPYCQLEKELLAVCWALSCYHYYCYGKSDITVETDHKPLIAIHKKSLADAPKRLQRILLTLQKYTYNVVYCPGSRLVIADALSRAYLPHGTAADFSEDDEQHDALRMVTSPATIELLRQTAEADDDYQLLLRQITL